MVLSKRERYIAIGTVAAVALLIVYYMMVGPLLADNATYGDGIADYNLKLQRAQNLMDLSKRLGPVWNQRVSGPIKKSASDAESQMLQSIATWARDARMTPPSIDKPDRPEKEKDFYRMTYRCTAVGTMRQIKDFLWGVYTSSVPVKVTEFTLTTRKEATDDLSLQLTLSTMYLSPDYDKPKPATPAAGAGSPVASKDFAQ